MQGEAICEPSLEDRTTLPESDFDDLDGFDGLEGWCDSTVPFIGKELRLEFESTSAFLYKDIAMPQLAHSTSFSEGFTEHADHRTEPHPPAIPSRASPASRGSSAPAPPPQPPAHASPPGSRSSSRASARNSLYNTHASPKEKVFFTAPDCHVLGPKRQWRGPHRAKPIAVQRDTFNMRPIPKHIRACGPKTSRFHRPVTKQCDVSRHVDTFVPGTIQTARCHDYQFTTGPHSPHILPPSHPKLQDPSWRPRTQLLVQY